MPYVPPHLRGAAGNNSASSSNGFTTVQSRRPGAYVPPSLRTAQQQQDAIPESEKPKTVVAGADTIDTYEIEKKDGPLSMAEKLALANTGAAGGVKNVKARAKPTKRQVQLSKEKESAISDQAFYDQQVADQKLALKEVLIDGAVLTQIIQHAQSQKYDSVKGQLLGTTKEGVLKISSAFPLQDEDHSDGSYPQIKAEAQAENHYTFDNVGWYLSTLMDSHLNMSTIETQYKYQRIYGNQCVFLVYDSTKSETKGSLMLKAYRLSDGFMDLIRDITAQRNQEQNKKTVSKTQHDEELRAQIELDVKYTGLPANLPFGSLEMETIINKGVNSANIFTEVPLRIENNLLIETFLHELDEDLSLDEPLKAPFDSLDLSTRNSIEKRLGNLYVSHDDLQASQARYLSYLKAAAQVKKGQTHLPKYISSALHRKPNPVGMLLNRNRIQQHCESLLEDSSDGLEKLELLASLEQIVSPQNVKKQ